MGGNEQYQPEKETKQNKALSEKDMIHMPRIAYDVKTATRLCPVNACRSVL